MTKMKNLTNEEETKIVADALYKRALLITPEKIKARIESLRIYRMSFIMKNHPGEYIINGIILDRIFPLESHQNNTIKIDLKDIVLNAIDKEIDSLVKLLKEEN